MMNVIVLMSGGIDSTTLAAAALNKGVLAACFFVDWGQTSFKQELRATQHWCNAHNVELITSKVQLDARNMNEDSPGARVVVSRNLTLASMAANVAASIGADSIWYGATKDDYRQYSDCRPEWIDAVNRVLRYDGISISAPLVRKNKLEIIRLSESLGVDINSTFSCYSPECGNHCGECSSCLERFNGIKRAKFQSPGSPGQ